MGMAEEDPVGWLEGEVASCQFRDVRHGKRFCTLLGQLSERIGAGIPFACQDWASTKAAYRFLANERVDEEKIPLLGICSAHGSASLPRSISPC